MHNRLVISAVVRAFRRCECRRYNLHGRHTPCALCHFLQRVPARSVVGYSVDLFPWQVVLHLQMTPQRADIGEVPSTDTAFRLSIMPLHMLGQRVAVTVGGSADRAL